MNRFEYAGDVIPRARVIYYMDDVRVEESTFERIIKKAPGLLRIANVERGDNIVHLFFVTF